MHVAFPWLIGAISNQIQARGKSAVNRNRASVGRLADNCPHLPKVLRNTVCHASVDAFAYHPGNLGMTSSPSRLTKPTGSG